MILIHARCAPKIICAPYERACTNIIGKRNKYANRRGYSNYGNY